MFFVDLWGCQLHGRKKEPVEMIKHVLVGLFIIAISTLTYNLPNYIVNIKAIDQSLNQKEFYNFFAWKLAGSFLLNAVYAFLLMIYINPKLLIIKLVVCWMFIAETITFIWHVSDKFYKHQIYNQSQSVWTIGIFTVFCSFFFYRAIYKKKSDEFRPDRTYVIYYLPKDFRGILNYLFDHSGHKAIYQDLKIYAFKKTTGTVRETPAIHGYFENPDIRLKEIPAIKDIESLIGKKYNLRTFNCNHLEKYATQH